MFFWVERIFGCFSTDQVSPWAETFDCVGSVATVENPFHASPCVAALKRRDPAIQVF